jgi:hypothetical protein
MSPTLNRVIAIVSHHCGVPVAKLSKSSAIDQDIKVSGDDVTELVEVFAKEFGDYVWQWPWQRFAELSEPSALVVPYFLWRLLTWPIRGCLFDPSPFERLELGHIAAVIDHGEWFEPEKLMI